mmetsp:Transcript_25939/g.66047  ORF Transcript_25939/g.66047 Transcript_25939/m.66047 type:complete len:738 (-) Transcript_25939:226-2439(-)
MANGFVSGAYAPLVERPEEDDPEVELCKPDRETHHDIHHRRGERGSMDNGGTLASDVRNDRRPQVQMRGRSRASTSRMEGLVTTAMQKLGRGEIHHLHSGFDRSVPKTTMGRIWGHVVIYPEPFDPKFKWLRGWNDLLVVTQYMAAYMVPFHIAFPEESDDVGYPVLSRVLDFLFTMDILVNFCTAFRPPEDSTEAIGWVADFGSIAKRYCGIPGSYKGEGGWFWVDLISVAPALREIFLGGWFYMNKAHTRLFHALRLTRFVRLFTSTRMEHFEQTIEATRVVLGLRYFFTEALKFLFITTLTCHIAACIWIGIEGKVTYPLIPWTATFESSWLSVLIQTKGDPCYPDAGKDPACVYIVSLYWAMMTLTTVGYGDILPQNRMEYLVCTVFMLVAGFVWAYIVGQVVNLLYALDPEAAQFKQDTDAINALMANKFLPQSLRVELRQYMVESKHVAYQRNQQELMSSHISITLQGKVAQLSPVHRVLVQKVFWFGGLDSDAGLEVVRTLEAFFYGPKEVIPIQSNMIIMQRGIATVNFTLMFKNDVYGEDKILLESAHLTGGPAPRTLSYVDILKLTKERLHEVCRIFPQVDAHMRRAQVKTAAFHGFIYAARVLKDEKDMVSSETMGRRDCRGQPRTLTNFSPVTGANRRSFANFEDEFGLKSFLPMSLEHQTSMVKGELEEMENRLLRKMKEMMEPVVGTSGDRHRGASTSADERETARQAASSTRFFATPRRARR